MREVQKPCRGALSYERSAKALPRLSLSLVRLSLCLPSVDSVRCRVSKIYQHALVTCVRLKDQGLPRGAHIIQVYTDIAALECG